MRVGFLLNDILVVECAFARDEFSVVDFVDLVVVLIVVVVVRYV